MPGSCSASSPNTATWSFDSGTPGQAPAGFTCELTGSGKHYRGVGRASELASTLKAALSKTRHDG